MSGFFAPGTVEQVRAASDIVEVIGAVLPLKRAGTNFTALCPFHKEKTPSFNVSPAKQIFYCFGCHKGGDVFKFIQEYENITFPEAVRRLAERANIPIQYERGGPDDAARFQKESLLKVHEQITLRWHHALLNEAQGQIARDYLAKRGVTEEAVKRFRLGYAPDAWDDTVNWAKSKGHSLELVEQGGLVIRKEGEAGAARHYDRFRGRLMFPICDEQGRVIGFSGRILTGDEKTAKYVNSPETPIFTKGKVMFGLDKSKRAILDAGHAIICEGQLDLIACYMAGIQNVVAPQGTALTGDHARILKRYVDEVVLCFDSDSAGQNAAIRALDDLLGSGLAVRVATVPSPHDPDSFIKAHGGEAMRQLLGGAEGFFDFYLNRLVKLNDARTDRGRLAIVAEISEAANKTGNAVLIDSVIQKTAQRLAVSPEAVRAEFRKVRGAPRRVSETDEAAGEPATPGQRPTPLEMWLVKLLFHCDEHMDWIAAHLDPDWLRHPAVLGLARRRLDAHAADSWRGAAALMTELEDEQARALLGEALSDSRAVAATPAQQLCDLFTRLRAQFIDQQLAVLTQQIQSPETPEARRVALMHEQQQLRALKRQPLAPPAAAPV
jgi:DNA primase